MRYGLLAIDSHSLLIGGFTQVGMKEVSFSDTIRKLGPDDRLLTTGELLRCCVRLRCLVRLSWGWWFRRWDWFAPIQPECVVAYSMMTVPEAVLERSRRRERLRDVLAFSTQSDNESLEVRCWSVEHLPADDNRITRRDGLKVYRRDSSV